jgi:hypothetical protein
MKLISRGEMPQPVPMKTRQQMISGIYQIKLAILSREKLEEPAKKKEKKGEKKPEAVSGIKAGEASTFSREKGFAVETREAGANPPETRAAAETGEADVALIAEELEKLEARGGTEPVGETDLIKREMEELEKEAKKKKKKGN